MKKFLSLILAVVLVFSLCACAQVTITTSSETKSSESAPAATADTSAAAAADTSTAAAEATPVATPAPTTAPASAAESQLNLLFANFSKMNPGTDAADTYYAVTDLDHNGRLELLGAQTSGTGMITTAKFFEVNESYDGIQEITQDIPSGYTMPEVIVESANTYHDTATNTYYYGFIDTTRDTAAQNISAKTSISLKDSKLTVKYYGSEQTEVVNGITAVHYYDADGNTIDPESYKALDNAITGYTKTGTNFDWFKAADATSESRLATSYAVFNGSLTPSSSASATESSSTSTTPASPAATATPAPTNNINIVDAPTFLYITKNPTSEYNHYVGDSCEFIAKADNATTASWTFVDPYGNQYNTSTVANYYGVGVSGATTGTLYLYNLPLSLNGWGVFCTFSGNGQVATTNTAYIGVSEKTVYNYTYGYLNLSASGVYAYVIYLPSYGTNIYASPAICSVDGTLYDGASCDVYFTGTAPSSDNVYSVSVHGSTPTPTYTPTQRIEYGYLGRQETMSTIPVLTTSGYYQVSLDFIYPQGADLYENRPCTVYFVGQTDTVDHVELG